MSDLEKRLQDYEPLIYVIARSYSRKTWDKIYDLPDLLQEGRMKAFQILESGIDDGKYISKALNNHYKTLLFRRPLLHTLDLSDIVELEGRNSTNEVFSKLYLEQLRELLKHDDALVLFDLLVLQPPDFLDYVESGVWSVSEKPKTYTVIPKEAVRKWCKMNKTQFYSAMTVLKAFLTSHITSKAIV